MTHKNHFHFSLKGGSNEGKRSTYWGYSFVSRYIPS